MHIRSGRDVSMDLATGMESGIYLGWQVLLHSLAVFQTKCCHLGVENKSLLYVPTAIGNPRSIILNIQND